MTPKSPERLEWERLKAQATREARDALEGRERKFRARPRRPSFRFNMWGRQEVEES